MNVTGDPKRTPGNNALIKKNENFRVLPFFKKAAFFEAF